MAQRMASLVAQGPHGVVPPPRQGQHLLVEGVQGTLLRIRRPFSAITLRHMDPAPPGSTLRHQDPGQIEIKYENFDLPPILKYENFIQIEIKYENLLVLPWRRAAADATPV